MQEEKKETLTVEELNTLAGETTKNAADEMKKRLDVVLLVKDGYLIREYKNGKKEKIRKILSTKVTPGSIIKIKK